MQVPGLEQKRIDEQWAFGLFSNHMGDCSSVKWERNFKLLQHSSCRSRDWEPEECDSVLRDTILQELPRLLVHSCKDEVLVPLVVDILTAKYGSTSKKAVTYLFP